MSMREYLRGEGAALSDDRSSIEWDSGDRLRWLANALIGRGSEFSREGVRARAKQQREKDFNTTNAGDIKEAQDYLSGTGISTAGGLLGGNKTEAETKANIESLKRTGEYAQEYAKIPGARLTDIKSGSSLSTIENLATQLQEQNKADKEAKLEADKLHREGREDAATYRQFEESRRQFDNRMSQARRQEQNSIDLQREKLGLNRLQLQMDQSRYMYDLQTRRQENRQKQATGLAEAIAALGIAFTI